MVKRNTQSTVLGIVLLSLAFGTSGSAQLPRLDDLMQEKLEHAQGLLGAMILNDLREVERLADELVQVSDASQWSPSQEPEYLRRARDFRASTAAIAEQARAGYSDGVALAYMEVTLSCIQCHRFLRGGPQAD